MCSVSAVQWTLSVALLTPFLFLSLFFSLSPCPLPLLMLRTLLLADAVSSSCYCLAVPILACSLMSSSPPYQRHSLTVQCWRHLRFFFTRAPASHWTLHPTLTHPPTQTYAYNNINTNFFFQTFSLTFSIHIIVYRHIHHILSCKQLPFLFIWNIKSTIYHFFRYLFWCLLHNISR